MQRVLTRASWIGVALMLLTWYWLLLRLRPGAVIREQADNQKRGGEDSRNARPWMTQLASAIERAAELHPLRPQCLERALVCRAILALAGEQVRVVLGVRRDHTLLEAHAWVEMNGVRFFHRPQLAFTRLVTLS